MVVRQCQDRTYDTSCREAATASTVLIKLASHIHLHQVRSPLIVRDYVTATAVS
jgi:hypothetical protein